MNHLVNNKILNIFVTGYLKSQYLMEKPFTYRHYHCSCYMDYTKRKQETQEHLQTTQSQ